MSTDRRAFNPGGKTIAVAGATTAPTGGQAIAFNATASSHTNQYRIHNAGTVTAFIASGVDASTAQTNSVIPTGTGASSKDSYPIVAGGVEVWSFPPNTFFSAITASGTATIYITPGSGL